MKIDELSFNDDEPIDLGDPVEEVQEVTEQEEVQEIQEDPIVEEEQDEPQDDLAKVVYNALVERNIFGEDEKFDGSFDWIANKLDNLVPQMREDIVNSIPEKGRRVVDFILTSGDSLTESDLSQFIEKYVEESQTFETMDEARSFLHSHYKKSKMKDSVIEAMLNALEDEDGLLEEANNLKEKETEKILEQRKEQVRLYEEQQKQYNTKLREVINTSPRKAVIENTLKTVNTTINEIVSDPAIYVQFLDMLSLYNPKTKSFDLSSLEKQAESPSVEKLKKALQKAGINPRKNVSNEEPLKSNIEFI